MKVLIISKKSIFILAIILLIAIIAILFFFDIGNRVVSVFSPNKLLPIYSVETDEKKIAISFDAAWGDEYTRGILDILDKYNVKTTFFIVGFWADKYPDMVKEISNRGHEIGNHSSTHPHMSKLSKEQIIQEVTKTSKKIQELTGKKDILFRPPFGDYNDTLIKTLEELGYYTIQWDVETLNTKVKYTQSAQADIFFINISYKM